MRRTIIKITLFLFITLAALADYRMVTIYNGHLMLSNFDKRDTWSEVYQLIPNVMKAERYDPVNASIVSGEGAFDYYIVLYTHSNLYNVRARENDLIRVEHLLANERITIMPHDPVELWFYGLLYMLIILFPIMRTVDHYEQNQGDRIDG
ncbi:MAG: hypothetical protein K9K93_03100 [Acholeplasmataceae bacterium]|nr:hypothetical protein [Acholeplasmataceae bacterium]